MAAPQFSFELLDASLQQPLEAITGLRATARFRSALEIAEQVRVKAKQAGRLGAYLLATTQAMRLATPMLAPALGREMAVEAMGLVTNIDAAQAIEKDLDVNRWMQQSSFLPGIHEQLTAAVGQSGGYNHPGLLDMIAQGAKLARQRNDPLAMERLRAYSARIFQAGDDLELALHSARQAISRGANEPNGATRELRWQATYDQATLLMLSGDPMSAREAAHRALELAGYCAEPLPARLKTRFLLQDILILMRASTVMIEKELAAFAGDVPPASTEYPRYDVRRSMAEAIAASQQGEHAAAAQILQQWDIWLTGRQATAEWFEVRLRLIAIQQRAGNPVFPELIKQLEKRAAEARDYLTLRRVRLLAEGPLPEVAIPLANPLSRGPAAPRRASAPIVASPLDGPHAQVVESLKARLTDEITEAADAKRKPDTSAILNDVMSIPPAEVTDPAVAADLLLLLSGTIRWVFKDIITWAWASQLASQFPRDATTLNQLATLGFAMRSKPDSPLAAELAAPNLVKMFEQSLEMGPEIALNFARAASFYLAVNDRARAEHCLTRAYRLDRTDAWVAVRLAELYTLDDRDADALVVLDSCLRKGGMSPQLLWQAGLTASSLNRHEMALVYFDRLELMQPHQPWVQYHRAVALMETGHPTEAAVAVDREQMQTPGCRFHLVCVRAGIAAKTEQIELLIARVNDALSIKLGEVDNLTPGALAGCLAMLWRATEVLPSDGNEPHPLRVAVEDRWLGSGLPASELFTHQRKVASTPRDVSHFICTVRQHLDENWADRSECLISQRHWTAVRIDYGVLASDEHEAGKLAAFWQLRCGMFQVPIVENIRREPERYVDHPGVTWRSYPTPVDSSST